LLVVSVERSLSLVRARGSISNARIKKPGFSYTQCRKLRRKLRAGALKTWFLGVNMAAAKREMYPVLVVAVTYSTCLVIPYL